MPDSCPFRQVEEKHVSTEVVQMLWSPKMDLVAVANKQAEVILYRLSWQKVWTLPPVIDSLHLTALAWRPDGKVLAVSYSSGKILLCDVENSATLHEIDLNCMVTSLSWVSEHRVAENSENEMPDCYEDVSSTYLPQLPPISKGFGGAGKNNIKEDNMEDAKKLKEQTDLNTLVIGTEDGHVHLYAYAIFPVAKLDLNQHGTGRSGKVLSAYLSGDLQLLSLVVSCTKEDGMNQEVHLISFETTLLASRNKEICILALKFGRVLTLLTYLDTTIQQMSEAWEDILLEMDSKLIKFAEQKSKLCAGSVSTDFLKLLIFGVPSDELQNFLLHDLTEKGLKKLGHSIETSYSNIQQLVLKHLQSVCQAVVYHLAELKGMAEWYERFGVLGLSGHMVQQALSTAGSLMLKASELQQVIDASMKNLKAFFRWLYVIIKRLSDEPIPAGLSKMTQQDLNFVAQFLKENFTEDQSGTGSGFKLEKVGQSSSSTTTRLVVDKDDNGKFRLERYLKSEDLHDPPDCGKNPWMKHLEENMDLQGSAVLYPAYRSKSLTQMFEMLQNNIDTTLHKCARVIGQSLLCVSSVHLYSPESPDGDRNNYRTVQFSKNLGGKAYLYTMFTSEATACEKCWLVRQMTTSERALEGVCLRFGELGNANESMSSVRCSSHKVFDVNFYDADTISLLLQQDTEELAPVLAQLPITAPESHMVPLLDAKQPIVHADCIKCVDAGEAIDSMSFRCLENMKASRFAVSGTRKVACVLFASRRRVRLFMMDAEEEEDDDDDEDEELEESHSGTENTPISEPMIMLTQDIPAVTEADENKENSPESSSMELL